MPVAPRAVLPAPFVGMLGSGGLLPPCALVAALFGLKALLLQYAAKLPDTTKLPDATQFPDATQLPGSMQEVSVSQSLPPGLESVAPTGLTSEANPRDVSQAMPELPAEDASWPSTKHGPHVAEPEALQPTVQRTGTPHAVADVSVEIS